MNDNALQLVDDNNSLAMQHSGIVETRNDETNRNRIRLKKMSENVK